MNLDLEWSWRHTLVPTGSSPCEYDAAGNRVPMDRRGITTTYCAYESYDKLCASSTSSTTTCATKASSSVTKYYYDASGNIVNRAGSKNDTYTFDVDNRLVTAIVGGKTYTFAYDGLGDRVRETGPSGSKTYNNTYVASGDQMLYLKNVVGSTTSKTAYLYAGSLLIATVSGSTYSYFHADHLGNTRLVTQAGSVVFASNYEPFGVQYAASGVDPSVKYTGQWDEALGLYWNHARYYDPTLGRFVSQDPVLGRLSRPQTMNRYAYVANNPLRWLDPTGRWFEDFDWASFGAFLAGVAVMAGAIALCATGVGCIGVIAAFAIATAAGAATGMAVTAAQGKAVTVQTAVNGGLMGLFGASLVSGFAGAGLFGTSAAGAVSTMETISAGTLASVGRWLFGDEEPSPASPSATGTGPGEPEPLKPIAGTEVDFAPGGRQAALANRPWDVDPQQWLQGVKDIANERTGPSGSFSGETFPNLLTSGTEKYGYVWGDFNTLYHVAVDVGQSGITDAYVYGSTRIPFYGR